MKKILILSFFALLGFYGNAAVKNTTNAPDLSILGPEFSQMSTQGVINLTPKQYHAMTGKKLTVKQVLALKVAQSQLKKQAAGGGDMPKGLYIVLAIIGWGFLGIGLLSDWKGNEWWICLLLTVLCWLPGVIYALIKMKNYY